MTYIEIKQACKNGVAVGSTCGGGGSLRRQSWQKDAVRVETYWRHAY